MKDWLQDALFGAKRSVSPMELSFALDIPLESAEQGLKTYFNDNSSRLTAAIVLLTKSGLVYCEHRELESMKRSCKVNDWYIACVSPSDASSPTVFLDSLARASDYCRSRSQGDMARLSWLVNPEISQDWSEVNPAVQDKNSVPASGSKNKGARVRPDLPSSSAASKNDSQHPEKRSPQQNNNTAKPKVLSSGRVKEEKRESGSALCREALKASQKPEQAKGSRKTSSAPDESSKRNQSKSATSDPSLFVDEDVNEAESDVNQASDADNENLLGEIGETPVAEAAGKSASLQYEPMEVERQSEEEQNNVKPESPRPEAGVRKVKKVVKYKDSEGYDVEEERWVDERAESDTNVKQAEKLNVERGSETAPRKPEPRREPRREPRPQAEKPKKQGQKQQKTLLSFFGKK